VVAPTKGSGVPPPPDGFATVTLTMAVAPTATGKVAAVVVSMKDWLVAVTVRFTVVLTVVVPLVPETVMACAPEGNVIFAAVVMVRTTGMVWRGLPSSVTLAGLKLQSAPAGRFAVQLPGFDAVEFVKFTVPVKPLVGAMVIVEVAVWPAGTLRVAGLGVMLNGAVTVTVAAAEVAALLEPSPRYVAVTLFVPAGSAAVEKVAVPVVRFGKFIGAVPKTVVVPLLRVDKLTLPTAEDGLTTTVKVTLVP
jgi:hypothetical protein